MCRLPILPMVYSVFGLLGLFGPCGLATTRATDTERLANDYASWIQDVDSQIGGDWSALLGEARDLDRQFRGRLGELEAQDTQLPLSSGSGLTRVGKRVLRQRDVVLAAESLGEVSNRLQVALNWVDYALMSERYARSQARTEAGRRNWDEACRVFAEYQAHVAARQEALRDLWRLQTGRGRLLVAVGGTASFTREATPDEVLQFAIRKAQFALSPISVRSPQWTRIKDLWSRERLLELTRQQPQLQRLQGLIQGELRNLRELHFERVEADLARGTAEQQLLALGSLGWWTDHRGIRLIREGLRAEPDDPRQGAALSALERLQLSAKDLGAYASHTQPAVRQAVARLLRHRVGEGPDALPLLQNLAADPEEAVRQAAYESAANLFHLGYGTPVFQVRWAARGVRCADPETVLDAIEFLAARSEGLDPATRLALAQVLGPSTRSANLQIREAAQAAFPR